MTKASGPSWLLAGLALFAGCSRDREPVAPASPLSASPRLTSRVIQKASNHWGGMWAALAQRPPAYGPGSEWELLEVEATPFGPRQASISWVLLEVGGDGARGRFEVRPSNGRIHEREVDLLHLPRVPASSSRQAYLPNPEFPRSGPLAPVSTAAGEFACARMHRSSRRSTGENLEIDEWWAPNHPVPVQSWERPVAESTGRLYDPPADPTAMPVGCRLQRLVRVNLVPAP